MIVVSVVKMKLFPINKKLIFHTFHRHSRVIGKKTCLFACYSASWDIEVAAT